ncbi:hypothetical protein PINS_up024188 [Pythium insidiosum]|nr:hypothetical protein PINS_up004769 [Pythium insidiosum]GLE11639.1 hypothetical protein PINS_up024188 [Pythium insidiosum]
MMSEDEFVVLMEHAGLVDSFDDSDQEFVEKTQLLEWLEREGAELFRDRMEESCPTDDAHEMAEYIFAKTVEKRWLTLAPADAADEDDQDMELYTLRLSTTEAYQIYVEKDSEPSSGLGARTASNRSLLDAARERLTEVSSGRSSLASASDEYAETIKPMRIREKMWQDCFPTCSESCKQLYFSFESPVVVLYATLGLNLIGNGISSVPAFSRELKSLGISHEDRTVIVGFLSRAFPSE